MIDIANDDLISFAEAIQRLPAAPGGKRFHIATIHRWRSPGVNGVRLEAVRIGGAWYTSWPSVCHFVKVLSNIEACEKVSTNHAADAECEGEGF